MRPSCASCWRTARTSIIGGNSGWTPLISASFRGHLAFVRLLCDAPGIDFAARAGGMKLTALGWAVYRKHAEVAAFLRSRGAPE